jgi:alpha-mannosidase
MYEGGGPVPYGIQTVPEPGPTQAIISQTTFGIWDEDIYQLAIDFSTLYRIRYKLDPDSLRVSEIDQVLMDSTLVIDLGLAPDERQGTIREGRALLQRVLQCVNGSTAPILYAIGHAHLDVAWLWPWAETEQSDDDKESRGVLRHSLFYFVNDRYVHRTHFFGCQ